MRTACLTLLPALGLCAAAQAEVYNVGWVLANEPHATVAYQPNFSTTYNSAGGEVRVTPISTGYFEVQFGRLFNGVGTSDVQVTAYETTGYCVSSGWSSTGTAVDAWVRCFDAHGNPANTQFLLLYQDRVGHFGDSSHGLAFVWADQPTSTSYTPSTGYQFNSQGAANTIVRNSTGNYTVDIPSLDFVHSDVQITAYGTIAARCKVSGWGPNGTISRSIRRGEIGTSIGVLCFDNEGKAADEQFDLAYAANEPFGLTIPLDSPGAWVWANHPGPIDPNVPATEYQYNGYGDGHVYEMNLGSTGSYQIDVPPFDDPHPANIFFSSTVLVTAYGTDSSYCNTGGWFPIIVKCYKQGGAGINTEFDAALQTTGFLK